MTLDYIAVNKCRVARGHSLGHAIVDLEPRQRSGKHVLAGRIETIFLKMLHPSQATAATVGLADLD
ncbi:hypothetical protein [uncultured Roseibium sp.]|uniref:hypothetical protein n=1 Tax=uncultured Roseibium sp. TaxID=1936171 RepID=UPI0026203E6E|nr:hypothetical protein [uncultured Roseibium sp.]